MNFEFATAKKLTTKIQQLKVMLDKKRMYKISEKHEEEVSH